MPPTSQPVGRARGGGGPCFFLIAIGLAAFAGGQESAARPRINLAEQFAQLQGLFAPFEGGRGGDLQAPRGLQMRTIEELLAEPDANPPAPPLRTAQAPIPRAPLRSVPSSTSPLPPLDPHEAFPPPMIVQAPFDPVAEENLLMAPQHLTSFRNSFFQKLSLQATYIGDGNHVEDLGFTEIETYLTVAVPFPIVEWPLLITPYYQMRLLAGPQNTDLPPRLYDAYVDFMWVPQIVNGWMLILAVAPGVYTDFEKWQPDAFRVTGKALVRYDWIPDRLQAIAGVLYLGRANLPMLPAGGVIWTPTDDLRLELIFPKPKLAARFNVGLGFEDWLYTTAEFGGNTYSITRENGEHDKVTWQDFRFLLGVERKLNGGAGFRLEGGYVVGRKVDFTSNRGDFTAENSWLVRGGIIF